MKKIIAAMDGLSFSESTIQYAAYIAKRTHAHLVGVFLEDYTYNSYRFSDVTAYEGASFDQKIHELENEDKVTRDQSVELFKKACQDGGLNCSVHRDRNIAIHELLHEAVYADLLIIDCKETFTHYKENPPSTFLRDLLTDVPCPVLLVPGAYQPIEKIVILYNGEPSSVYAVKMFDYLLPAQRKEKVEVLTIKSEKEEPYLPDSRLVKEFMKLHHPAASYVLLKGEAEVEIANYLEQQEEHLLVVLGAYRRNRVSRWFKPSMADALLKKLKFPLFIAHNK